MYWQDDDVDKDPVPEDVFDLLFKVKGKNLPTDHAFALATSLREFLDGETCGRIAVHQIRMGGTGNGWTRPQDRMILSGRTRLVIRAQQQDREALLQLAGQRLELEGESIQIGTARVRKFTTADTLFAHALVSDANQPEAEFLADIAACLGRVGIQVKKMICGTSGLIRNDTTDIFTRSLLVANLKPEESIALQRSGIGDYALLGCGIFVPHKGIDAVYQAQEN